MLIPSFVALVNVFAFCLDKLTDRRRQYAVCLCLGVWLKQLILCCLVQEPRHRNLTQSVINHRLSIVFHYLGSDFL